MFNYKETLSTYLEIITYMELLSSNSSKDTINESDQIQILKYIQYIKTNNMFSNKESLNNFLKLTDVKYGFKTPFYLLTEHYTEVNNISIKYLCNSFNITISQIKILITLIQKSIDYLYLIIDELYNLESLFQNYIKPSIPFKIKIDKNEISIYELVNVLPKYIVTNVYLIRKDISNIIKTVNPINKVDSKSAYFTEIVKELAPEYLI